VAKYRKIDSRIWNDQKFRDLSDQGKLVFFFLLTHPYMTALGAMRSTIPGLAAELGWTEKAFREAFLEISNKGMSKHDSESCFLWMPNFLKYNKPESPNVVKAWLSSLDLLPECNMKQELIQEVKGFTEGLPESFNKALPEVFAKSMPYQEQEQEQDKEKIPTVSKRKIFKKPTLEEVSAYCQERSSHVDPERFIDHYESNGWMVGKTKMKNWQAAVRTWEKNSHEAHQKPSRKLSAADNAAEASQRLEERFRREDATALHGEIVAADG